MKKRFRWRVIPVTILSVFGGLSLAGWLMLLGADVWWRFSCPDAVDLGVAPTVPMLVGKLFGVITAALYLLIALRLQQGRWRSVSGLVIALAAEGLTENRQKDCLATAAASRTACLYPAAH